MVENADFSIDANNGGFNGTVVIRGGKFSSSDNSCMTEHINSSGDISVAGSFGAGTVPELASLSAFQSGAIELLGWRELYQ